MQATDRGYSAAQILDMERRVLQALDWRLNPPTLFWHASLMLALWDRQGQGVQYLTDNRASLKRYRHFMQIVDLLLLDVSSRSLPMNKVVGSALVFSLLIQLQLVEPSVIVHQPNVIF